MKTNNNIPPTGNKFHVAVAYNLIFWAISSQFVTAERNAVSKATRKFITSVKHSLTLNLPNLLNLLHIK